MSRTITVGSAMTTPVSRSSGVNVALMVIVVLAIVVALVAIIVVLARSKKPDSEDQGR